MSIGLLRAFRAGVSALRNPPGAIPRWCVEPGPDGPRLCGTDLRIEDVRTRPFVVDAIRILAELVSEKKMTVMPCPDGVEVMIDKCKFVLQTQEEFYIVREVFQHTVYDVRAPRPYAVIDIGMNVGVASLWFASQADVLAVYGFEPFPATFRQAVRNMAANPHLAPKIHPAMVGLGSEDATLELAYDPDLKGKSSVLSAGAANSGAIGRRETIVVRAAATAVWEAFEMHPEVEWVIKIDCEGAEYDIVPALARAGVFDRVRGLAIEWHRDGPEPIASVLRTAGFTVASVRSEAPNIGMLYAGR